MLRKLIAALLMLCLLSGCAAPAIPEDTRNSAFVDALGRSVSVSSCQRVAALLGSFAQVWHLAGGTVCASADDAWEDFDLDLPDDAVNLGSTKQLSLEKLLECQPDLVLASVNTAQHVQWLDTLEAAGICVMYFDVADFEDYLAMLEFCAGLTGREDLYKENGLQVQQQIDAVLERSRVRLAQQAAPTVLSLRVSAGSIRAKNSQGNVLGEMLASLGCENLADSRESLLENLSLEYILLSDPDFIFIIALGEDPTGARENLEQFILDNPAWNTLRAVQEGRVFFMDKNLYNLKPNHRWGEAYEQLENILAAR